MSLVAYASSDSEEENEVPIPIVLPKKPEKKVKITIPSLEQFKDEEGDLKPVERPKPKSGSGLFSLLPPPKYSTFSTTECFKPHILTKKKESKDTPPKSKIFSQKGQSEGGKNDPRSDSDLTEDDISSKATTDDTSEPVIDYFSLDSSLDKSVGGPEVASSSDSRSSSTLFSSLPQPAQPYVAPTSHQEVSSSSAANSYESPLDANNYAQHSWDENYQTPETSCSVPTSLLEDERFKRLKGRREFEDINIIDVNADDQLTNKEEWLMQSLTEEKAPRPSKRRQDMPTQQQKRKHQITYLAHQAKERELDLKNQWALNSRTRRETQAKYGF